MLWRSCCCCGPCYAARAAIRARGARIACVSGATECGAGAGGWEGVAACSGAWGVRHGTKADTQTAPQTARGQGMMAAGENRDGGVASQSDVARRGGGLDAVRARVPLDRHVDRRIENRRLLPRGRVPSVGESHLTRGGIRSGKAHRRPLERHRHDRRERCSQLGVVVGEGLPVGPAAQVELVEALEGGYQSKLQVASK